MIFYFIIILFHIFKDKFIFMFLLIFLGYIFYLLHIVIIDKIIHINKRSTHDTFELKVVFIG
jgi:hypothetical protein